MNMLEYVPGTLGAATVQMDGGGSFVGTADNLRSRQWTYSLGYRALESSTRPAREVDVLFETDYATADALRRAADADVSAHTPGTFVAQGEWRQRGYIVACQPQYIHYGRVGLTLQVVLLDGAWWRLVEQTFYVDSGTPLGGYLDYDYDYPYDFMAPTIENTITPSVLTPSAVRLVIYGQVTNPYVIIGGNTYQVNVTVPAGGYLIVDGREKTITLVLSDGTKQNAFSYGVRANGEGGGTYIFEPIKGAEQDVQWLGTFEFDLGWYEEEGEPPWSR